MTAPASVTPWTNSEPGEIVGSTEPRLWTPPLRELTPATSYGFKVITFAADVLCAPLDPWEAWAVIHAGELLPNGRPRFRRVLILVSRQNGKTHLLVILTLYWLYVDQVPVVLGTSTKLDYAAESWRKACKLARRIPRLREEIDHRGAIRRANGEQVLWRADDAELESEEGSRYKIAASNEEGGRSLTVDRLVLDELRQHHDYSAWDASTPATAAVPDAQTFALSNAGSAKSVVLRDLRADAIGYINSGEGDPSLGLFEWSAPPGASPVDIDALAQANPNLGHPPYGRIDPDALLTEARTAMRQGGEKLAGFRTERMCQWVDQMDPVITPDEWKACLVPGDLADVRDAVVLMLDVSVDGLHASLVAAAVVPDPRPPLEKTTVDDDDQDALDDDRIVRVEPVATWEGPRCARELRRDLPGWVRKVRPRAVGWFPNGPAAELAADMAENESIDWPPAGVEVEEIRRDVPAVCMGWAGQVRAALIVHSGDPELTAQNISAEKLPRQNGTFVFTRSGVGHVDMAYAAAGAAHLARTLPPPKRKPKPAIV
jgi:hypothetical protein